MGASVVLGGGLDTIGRGAHDDGGEGVLRMKLAQGELVKLPIRQGTYVAAKTGGGTGSLSFGGVGSNEDGTGNNYQLSIPPAALPTLGGSAIRTQLWGRQIGVRWRRDNAAQVPPIICCVIDGVAYSYTNTSSKRDNVVQAQTDPEALWLVADDLADGPHTVEVILTMDPANVATYTLQLFGWIVEKRAGYEQKIRPDFFPASVAVSLTTSQVAIPNVNSVVGDLRAVRRLHFYNTDSVSHTVTVQYNSNILKVITIPATSHGEYDFGFPVGMGGFFTWAADLGAKVNAWVQGQA